MRLGFYDYNTAAVGTDGVIFKDSLKGGAAPSGVADVGTPVWGATGLTTSATSGINMATFFAANPALDTEGTIRLMCSSECISSEIADIPSGTTNWLGLGTPVFYMNRIGNASPTRGTHGYNRAYRGVPVVGRYGPRHHYFGSTHGWQADSDGRVEVVVTWDGGGVEVYVDKLLAISVGWTVAKPTINNLTLSLAVSGLVASFSDLLVSTKKTVLPTNINARTVNVYGDSYPKQGQYFPHDTSDYQGSAFNSVTEQGTVVNTLDGIVPTSHAGIYNAYVGTTAHFDAGMFPVIHRELNRKGLYTAELKAWVQGGSGFEATGGGLGETIPVRITKSLRFGPGPDIAVIAYGYNDAARNTGAGPSNLVTYKTLITDAVDELIAANANVQIVITNAVYNTDMASLPTPIATSAITNINGVLDDVASDYSQVKIADTFTAFGGLTEPSATYFQSDDLHPNTAGQALYGRTIAAQIT